MPTKTLVSALALATALAVTAPALANSMFDQGLQDRTAWEVWFNSLQGHYKTGAFYWSGQRSLPHPGSCQQMDADFYRGCTAAKVKLATSDTMRKTEPAYKAGWNAWTPGEPSAVILAPKAPAAPLAPATNGEDAIPTVQAHTSAMTQDNDAAVCARLQRQYDYCIKTVTDNYNAGLEQYFPNKYQRRQVERALTPPEAVCAPAGQAMWNLGCP